VKERGEVVPRSALVFFFPVREGRREGGERIRICDGVGGVKGLLG
jgi:hypothetical protein